jgi:Tol biopolymer transport system component
MMIRKLMVVAALVAPCALRAQNVTTGDMIALHETASFMGTVTESPDGRWVVMSKRNAAADRSRLYIAAPGSKTEIALTTDGFSDIAPFFADGNDRVFFTSTRGDRQGGTNTYAMVQAFNPATGEPRGGPQQISTEPVAHTAWPTRDGRWVVYPHRVPDGIELRVIPATGGAARTIARVGTGIVAVAGFDAGNRNVYYQVFTNAGKPNFSVELKRVPFAGGPSSVVARSNDFIRLLPGDPSYIVHQHTRNWGVSHVGFLDIRTLDGKLVRRVQVPQQSTYAGFSGDGKSLILTLAPWQWSIRAVSIDGSQTKVLTTVGDRYLEGWSADSRSVLTDFKRNDRASVQFIGLDGSAQPVIDLPAVAVAHGWSGVVGNHLSYRTAVKDSLGLPFRNDALYSFDVRTRTPKLITASFMEGIVSASGGADYERDSFVYVEESRSVGTIKTTNPETGVTRTVRTFPLSFFANNPVWVSGDRVAYLEDTKDSVTVWVTNDAQSPAVKVITLPPGAGGRFWHELAWSRQGDRLVITHAAQSPEETTSMAIVTFDASGRVTKRERIDTGAHGMCWGNQWVPDDSAIVALCQAAGRNTVTLIPTNGSAPRVLAHDGSHTFDSIHISPDGKWVAYSAMIPSNTTIWKVQLVQ